MKKILLFTLAGILLAFSGCKKDKDDISQVPFTYKSMSPLVGKSLNYIKQASPGVINEDETEADYLSFTYDKVASLGDIWIGYSFISSKCDNIMIFPESEELSALDYLLSMAENEVGAAISYNLSYTDADYIDQEEIFDTYDELWGFIDDNSIDVNDIIEINCGYSYGDYLIIVGGLWIGGYFWPVAEITLSDSIKSTSPKLNTNTLIEHIKNLELTK